MRIAVLASGRGSNLARILETTRTGLLSAEVALVVVNRPGVGAEAIAREAGIPIVVEDDRAHPDRGAHERAIARALAAHGIELVVLAGYMRILTPFLVGFLYDPELGQSRIVNIHPADPARYRGPDGYGWAIATGQTETAVTVHFVDEGLDTGLPLRQETVPVEPGDTLDTLRARGLAVEHRLFPEALRDLVARLKGATPCVAS
ncbi:MAG: phosphoribosylglycinamide formyltransferase [bacterium]|nr:phosphoribosylglycinamide formyltransferase [bacterium]